MLLKLTFIDFWKLLFLHFTVVSIHKNTANDMREFSVIWSPQKILEFAVLIRINSTSPFSWSSIPIEQLSFIHHECKCQSNKLLRPSRLGNMGIKDVRIQLWKSCEIPEHLPLSSASSCKWIHWSRAPETINYTVQKPKKGSRLLWTGSIQQLQGKILKEIHG